MNFAHGASEKEEKELKNFYEQRDHQPVWMAEEGLTPCGKEVVQLLASVAEEGLDPQRYSSLLDLLSNLDFSDQEKCIAADEALTQAFLDYISIVGGERNNLRSFDKDLYVKEKSIDEIDVLKKGLASKGCSWIHQLSPQHAHYQNLKKLLARYRQKQKAGGWPNLPQNTSLKKGETNPLIKILRQQLIAQDVLEEGQGDFFDEKVEKALRAFQFFHGLKSTGLLNKETIEALNTPVEERIKEISLNLERWRWLPMDLGKQYLIVNIPTYELYAINQGKVMLKMPIIVGSNYRRTPIFTSLMTGITLNPPWTVPYSIATRDKLSAFSKNPGLLRRGKYRIFSKEGGEVSPESVNWSSLSKSHFPYVLRQDPGPQNALGKIKFNIQNPFSIYIHGTPNQELFQSSHRAKSSGCIRAAFPQDLALFVLNGDPKWDQKALEKATKNNTTQSIFLPHPLPVYITYMTVLVDEQGSAFFAPDIYRKNNSVEKLMRAQK